MNTRFAFAMAIGLLSFAGYSAVPNTFTAGTPAQASQVNQNFSDLDTRVGNSIGSVRVQTIDGEGAGTGISSGVVGASCPAGTVVAGVGCTCDSESGTRNYGVLFGCDMVGTGAVAGCFPDFTYTSAKPVAQAEITVKCLSATQNDGGSVAPTAASVTFDTVLEAARSNALIELQVREALLRSEGK